MGICEHGRVKYQCKECGGSAICEHGRQQSKCKECADVTLMCSRHPQFTKAYCTSCCEHDSEKEHCKYCNPARHSKPVAEVKSLKETCKRLYLASLAR